MEKIDNLKLYNADCMEVIKDYEDNYFDLAIVDPPYGINFAKTYTTRTQKDRMGLRHKSKEWDEGIPTDEYFIELQRVSKNQIIWGGNYFPYLWKNGCKGFIFWYKGNPVPNFSDGELAWTSFNQVARQFDYRYYGNHQGSTLAPPKIHPTQKPIILYEWLLKIYAKKGDKILDTHLGSGNSAIASYYFGCSEFVGIELDKDYYNNSIKHIKSKTMQIKLF